MNIGTLGGRHSGGYNSEKVIKKCRDMMEYDPNGPPGGTGGSRGIGGKVGCEGHYSGTLASKYFSLCL